ncbi:hypothetical protein MIR68_006880 [Amoeboaphelidium protococcarum]|nr:hypothetical protein MIR68_006880 [Amoeboaphelidium protococcarum]
MHIQSLLLLLIVSCVSLASAQPQWWRNLFKSEEKRNAELPGDIELQPEDPTRVEQPVREGGDTVDAAAELTVVQRGYGVLNKGRLSQQAIVFPVKKQPDGDNQVDPRLLRKEFDKLVNPNTVKFRYRQRKPQQLQPQHLQSIHSAQQLEVPVDQRMSPRIGPQPRAQFYSDIEEPEGKWGGGQDDDFY